MNKYVYCAMICWMVSLSGCSGGRPLVEGVRDGRLPVCPDRPNCVSSQDERPGHFIEPFRYSGSRDEALETMKRILSSRRRVTLVGNGNDYLAAEFKSRIFRFVDDGVFYFPPDQKVVHVRSASRVGYSDLGANRRRIERLRLLFSNDVQQGMKSVDK